MTTNSLTFKERAAECFTFSHALTAISSLCLVTSVAFGALTLLHKSHKLSLKACKITCLTTGALGMTALITKLLFDHIINPTWDSIKNLAST